MYVVLFSQPGGPSCDADLCGVCVCYCMFVVLGAGVVALVLASWAAASPSVVWTVSGEHVTPVTSLPIVSTLQQTT